jgi:hypothetical protein
VFPNIVCSFGFPVPFFRIVSSSQLRVRTIIFLVYSIRKFTNFGLYAWARLSKIGLATHLQQRLRPSRSHSPPGKEPKDERVERIAAAARDLVSKRDAWLNPQNASEAELRKRTLTNLYNQRPTWLDQAHRALDEAVFAAYGWPATLTDDEILQRLLDLNHQRASTTLSS